MKTSILALAIALAFSFTPTPAAGGLSNQTKCDSGKLLAAAKFSQCRIKVDFLALKKGAKLSAEKKEELQAKCSTKLTEAYDKLEGKYPATMSGGDDECGSYGDAQNMIDGLVAVSNAVADGSVSADGSGAVDPARACGDANGSWDGSVCTPAAAPDRDCFREGACGEGGYDFGDYVGVNSSSSGCSETTAGTNSYTLGTTFAVLFPCTRPACILQQGGPPGINLCYN